jgi:DNA-directed DNA polymerase III PolC
MASCCAPLRSRSSYSLLRGTTPLAGLVAAVREAGYTALALTDRNNLYGAVPFVRLARAAGLEPILGVELDQPAAAGDTGEGPVAVVLARGASGYRTLCRLVTSRQLDPAFQLAPALTAEHEDVHVLASDPPLVAALKPAMPRGRLWIDASAAARDRAAAPRALALARRLDLGAVAAFPVAYRHRQEIEVGRLLAAARTGVLAPAVPAAALADPTWMVRPPAELARLLADAPDLLAANRELAADCRAELPDSTPIFPPAPLAGGETPYSALLERCLPGIRRRYGTLAPAPVDRLMRELEVIGRLGFSEYFLVVGDIVAFARGRGVPVVGRGSGASSIVAYVLGITNVDPIAHRLHFERFLSAERGADLPDLDVDLDWRGRDQVIEHVYRAHGAERVAMISTHACFHPRSAFREAARAYGVPVEEVNRLARLLPHAGEDLEVIVRASPVVRDLAWGEEPWRSILAGAQGLLGQPRHLGIHSGGIVIADRPLADRVPLERAAKGIVVTQYEMEAVAEVGLVKIDLLGNRGLSTVAAAARLAGPAIDLDHPADRDPPTARLLAAGDTLGCFQIESPGMRNLLKMIAPASVREVVDALSLIRPGPASSGMKERFVRRARRLEPTRFVHPALAAVLAPTYGIPLYEEDVMEMAHAVAGMDLDEADKLRRAIAAAASVEEMRAVKNGFVARAVRAGVAPDDAVAVWDEMARFASYSFSRAHAAGYGVIAYQSVFLKTHCPPAFACAVLNHHQGMYPRWVHVEDARRHGVRILLPSVSRSDADFTLEHLDPGAPESPVVVRAGLGQVQGLSGGTIASLLAARHDGGPFTSIGDFRRRVRPAQPELETLIRVGGFDDLGVARSQLLWQARVGRVHGKGTGVDGSAGSTSAGLFAGEIGDAAPPALRELRPLRRLRDELSGLGISPRAHPLLVVAPGFREALPGKMRIAAAELPAHIGRQVAVVGLAAAMRRTPTRAGQTMAFLTLDDPSGMAECTVFPAALRRFAPLLTAGGPLCAIGRAEEQYGVVTLNVERLSGLPYSRFPHNGS